MGSEKRGMDLLRAYKSTWRMVAYFTWLFLLAAYVVLFIFVLLTPWRVPLEALHHLSFLSPLLAWWVARNEVEDSAQKLRGEAWVIAKPLPLWPLSVVLVYAVNTFLMDFSQRGELVSWQLLARLVLSSYWFIRCDRSADDVAVLSRARNEEGRRALQIEDFKGTRWVTLEAIDVATRKVRLSEGASVSTWVGISQLDKLGPAS